MSSSPSSNRGVILSVDFNPTPNGGIEIANFGVPHIESDVRQRLAYWDRIVLPATPLIGYQLSPDLEFLVAEGIASKPDLTFGGNWPNIAEMWAAAQLHLFKTYDGEHPGQWAMAQRSNQFWLPRDGQPLARSIELQLYGALPVPGPDVPIEDILLFKDKHASELLGLRALLDELYLLIVNSNDIPRSRIAAIDRIENALADLDRVTKESWKSRLMSTLQLGIPLKEVGERAAVGAGTALTLGLPAAAGAIAAVAFGALKFDLKNISFGSRIPASSKPLLYAHKLVETLGTRA